MVDPTYLVNGKFLHSIDGWDAAGATYSAGDGSDHYGVATIAPAGSISQHFAVDRARRYTLHLAVKDGDAAITIADGDGNALPAQTAPGAADVWTETTVGFGLAPGSAYTLTISNAGLTTILIDDVWLWWLPTTRARLAAIVARKLAALATGAEISTTPSGEQTEGGYTDAIDAALRAIGAIDPESDLPDTRYLTAGSLDSLLQQIERAMLEQLQIYYAGFVDTTEGPLAQKLSQIGAALARLTSSGAGGSGGGGPIVIRKLGHVASDYELGDS